MGITRLIFVVLIVLIVLIVVLHSVGCDQPVFYVARGPSIFHSNQQAALELLVAGGMNRSIFSSTMIYEGRAIHSLQSDGVFPYAYVGYCDSGRFLQLMEFAIQAIHEFSRYPILVYVSGSRRDIEFDYHKFDRLVLYLLPPDRRHIWFTKLRVALQSPVLVGQIVEADTLMGPPADLLFPKIERLITPSYPYPMMTRHWNQRLPRRGDEPLTGFELEIPLANRSMRYMHAHLSWTQHSLRSLAEVVLLSIRDDMFSDEDALNVYLWQKNATLQWCRYDPHYAESFWFSRRKMWEPDATYHYRMIHGQKTPDGAQMGLQRLRQMQRRNISHVCFLAGVLSKKRSECYPDEVRSLNGCLY